MKVGLISDGYLPRMGGIELHVHDLAHQVAAAGHVVHVVSPFCGPRAAVAGASDAGEAGVVVDPLDIPLWPRWQLAWTPSAAWRMDRLLRRRAFDVAHHHVSVLSPLGYGSVALCLYHRIPVVVTFHSVWRDYAVALRWYDRLVGWTRRPLVLSAVSASVAEDIRAVAGGLDVHVLPNGVDPGFWRVEDPVPAEGEVRVVAVLRLTRRKRPRALVDMVEAALPHVPDGVKLRLTIVGEGPERIAVERRVRERGLAGTVRLLGHRSRAEIRELFRRADLFALPTLEEAFGIAALEARAAGLPVVAMGTGGVAEIIRHGREGLLAHDDAGMVEALVRLVRDRGLRERIASHNRTVPPPDRWPDVVRRHLEIYELARGTSSVRS